MRGRRPRVLHNVAVVYTGTLRCVTRGN